MSAKVRVSQVATLAMALASASLLNGCDMLQTPEQVCVAPKTQDEVSDLLTSGLGSSFLALATLQGGRVTPDMLAQAVRGLWTQKVVTLDEITLKRFDKGTKVVQCAGSLKMKLQGDNSAEYPITFERQPEANGQDYVYRIVSVGDYQETLAALALGSMKAGASNANTQFNQQSAEVQPQKDQGSPEASLSAIPIAAPNPPAFDAYPATAYTGQPVLPDFNGSQKDYAEYRTRLIDQANQGVNFAGRMALAQIGCGAGCSSATVIDLSNGKLYNFPLGGEDNLQLDLKFKPDSNLINATWSTDASLTGADPTAYCVSQSFIWTGTDFKQIASSRQQGECPAR